MLAAMVRIAFWCAMSDDLQAQLAANRSEFYRAVASGPFCGYNRPGVEPSEAIIENWWRQGMMGERMRTTRNRRLLSD